MNEQKHFKKFKPQIIFFRSFKRPKKMNFLKLYFIWVMFRVLGYN